MRSWWCSVWILTLSPLGPGEPEIPLSPGIPWRPGGPRSPRLPVGPGLPFGEKKQWVHIPIFRLKNPIHVTLHSGSILLYLYTWTTNTFGPSGPGAPGIPLGPAKPWGPSSPLSPGIPRSPCLNTKPVSVTKQTHIMYMCVWCNTAWYIQYVQYIPIYIYISKMVNVPLVQFDPQHLLLRGYPKQDK